MPTPPIEDTFTDEGGDFGLDPPVPYAPWFRNSINKYSFLSRLDDRRVYLIRLVFPRF